MPNPLHQYSILILLAYCFFNVNYKLFYLKIAEFD